MKFYLLLLVFASCSCLAQKPVTIQLDPSSGLPDTEVYDLLEDSQGYIWIAANKGLFRFNGVEYLKYDAPDKVGLSVFNICEGTDHSIWSVNLNGQILRAQGKSLEVFLELGERLNFELISIIVTDASLYLFSSKKVLRVGINDKIVEKIFTSELRIGNPTFVNGKISFNVGNSIYSIQEGKAVEVFRDSLIKSKDSEEGRQSILFEFEQKYYLIKYLNGYELFEIDISKNKATLLFTPQILLNSRILNVKIINDHLYLSTNKGVFITSIENHRVHIEDTIFKGKNVSDLLVDQFGNYWFSSLNEGVFIISNLNLKKIELSSQSENISTLQKHDRNTLIFGNQRGEVFSFNIQSSEIKKLKGVSDKRVTTITKPILDTHYLVFQTDSVFKYDLNSHKLIGFENQLIGLKSFSKMDDENVVIGTYSSAKILKPSSRKSYKIVEYLDRVRAKSTYYNKLTEDIFVGYIDKLIQYRGHEEFEITLDGVSILATVIEGDSKGLVWIGTSKNGVLGYQNGKIKYHYNTSNGLHSNAVYNLRVSDRSIWVVTDSGIQKLTPEQNSILSYTKSQGIPSYQITGLELVDSSVYFSTNTGLYVLKATEDFWSTNLPPKIYLDKVFINNRETTKQKFYKLPNDDNAIRFDFFSNGYLAQASLEYQYKIDKKESVIWNTVPAGNSSLVFNRLSPGVYKIAVRALNPNTKLFSNTEYIIVEIPQPFWKTLWFFITCVILTTVTVVFILQRQSIQRNKRQSAKMKQLQQEKEIISVNLENLRSQMNPHFIFNALTAIQEYIMLNEKELASEYLVKFSRLIRIYLEHTQEETVTLDKEISALNLYLELEQQRFEEEFEVELKVDSAIEKTAIKIPSLFIQPYVENAVKHGLLHKQGKRILKLCFQKQSKGVLCVIEDNGVGRQKSEEIKKGNTLNYKSFATSANEVRLKLINKDRKEPISVTIEDLSNLTEVLGTRVTIHFPLK